jgi:hypothetical protein
VLVFLVVIDTAMVSLGFSPGVDEIFSGGGDLYTKLTI